jgi:hypothetical protein
VFTEYDLFNELSRETELAKSGVFINRGGAEIFSGFHLFPILWRLFPGSSFFYYWQLGTQCNRQILAIAPRTNKENSANEAVNMNWDAVLIKKGKGAMSSLRCWNLRQGYPTGMMWEFMYRCVPCKQCRGFGSGVRCLFDTWFRDAEKVLFGSRIPIPYF